VAKCSDAGRHFSISLDIQGIRTGISVREFDSKCLSYFRDPQNVLPSTGSVCFYPLCNLRLTFPYGRRVKEPSVCVLISSNPRCACGEEVNMGYRLSSLQTEYTLPTPTNYMCYFVAGSSILQRLCLRHSDVNKHFEIPTVIFMFVFSLQMLYE
jgi:hypothetical protein